VELDAARAFVGDHHHGVLATVRADGRPQLSPIALAVDDEGRVVVSTRETASKTANIRRNPAVSVCVLSDGFFGDWIQMDGQAEVVSLPEAMEPLVGYYRSVSGEHPDWDDYRAAMERERRVLVRITLDRAGPDRAG
jgi:PPOX class probable F420-dependent enzyme